MYFFNHELCWSVTYYVVINDKPSGNIKPARGLRQGDLLSPYLFLLYDEGLSSLLNKEKDIGKIKRMAVARNGPKVAHLFFADDSLLFCRAKEETVRKC